MRIQELLRKNPFTSSLSDPDISFLASCLKCRHYDLGVCIESQGTVPRMIGVIESGHANVVYHRKYQLDVILKTLGEADFFGLPGVYSDDRSVVGVVCIKPIVCWEDDYVSFISMLKDHSAIRECFYKAAMDSLKQSFRDLGRADSVWTPIQNESRPTQDRIERSLDYINKHYDGPLNLEKVARHCGMSKFYFSRIFKEKTGFSYKEYLNRVRINAARQYLARGDMNVSEVCFHIGFNDISYFCRVFKHHTGISPSRYRAEKEKSAPEKRVASVD